VLFGDGAGCVVIEAQESDRGIKSTHLYTDGRNAEQLWLEEPTSRRTPRTNPDGKEQYPQMNGREVFKHAVTNMSATIKEALDKQGWSLDDLSLIIPHQANYRISAAIAENLGFPMDRVYSNIHKYGNTTAATIPICMAEAEAEGKLKPGDKVIATAFGSGFTWASAAIIW